MPRILLLSATKAEIEPCLQFLQNFKTHLPNQYKLKKIELELCISGAGMVKTAFELGALKSRSFNLAIQAGIAGSFGTYAVGELLRVDEDRFSELGAENGDEFMSMDELGLGEQEQKLLYPYRHPFLCQLKKAKGITVNQVHGNSTSIQKIMARFHPDAESMEGAAFIYAANHCGWPALQLRAVSNLVEKRDRSKWNIPLAVKNLNDFLIQFLKSLDEN
ncbi:MAG TPA: futalosine hydrolase [Bacteroidia bacterium]|nr:futalosine hydrolase [Bacteroidia bacterium]